MKQVTAYETDDGRLCKTPSEARALELRAALNGWAFARKTEFNPQVITEMIADAPILHALFSNYVEDEFGAPK